MTLQVGISQIQNSTAVQENLAVILNCISKHQRAGCDLAMFPECALTGFSSLVKNTNFIEVDEALHLIQKQVDQGTTSAFVPAVVKNNEGEFINSGFYFQPHDDRVQFFKEGLTVSERKFFKTRPNTTRQFRINGYKIGFLICIEAAHQPWEYLHEGEMPDLILWPAYWGRDIVPSWNENLTADDHLVYQNSKIWKAPLLHATFFENHENVGLKPGPFGQSLVIDENSELFYSAAKSIAEDYVVSFERAESKKASIVGVRTLV